jgi:hypothetical protein
MKSKKKPFISTEVVVLVLISISVFKSRREFGNGEGSNFYFTPYLNLLLIALIWASPNSLK